jgi:hypothetical protein
LHDVDRRIDSERARAIRHALEVPPDDRHERRVDQRRRKTFVLAFFAHEIGGRRDGDVR